MTKLLAIVAVALISVIPASAQNPPQQNPTTRPAGLTPEDQAALAEALVEFNTVSMELEAAMAAGAPIDELVGRILETMRTASAIRNFLPSSSGVRLTGFSLNLAFFSLDFELVP